MNFLSRFYLFLFVYFVFGGFSFVDAQNTKYSAYALAENSTIDLMDQKGVTYAYGIALSYVDSIYQQAGVSIGLYTDRVHYEPVYKANNVNYRFGSTLNLFLNYDWFRPSATVDLTFVNTRLESPSLRFGVSSDVVLHISKDLGLAVFISPQMWYTVSSKEDTYTNPDNALRGVNFALQVTVSKTFKRQSPKKEKELIWY